MSTDVTRAIVVVPQHWIVGSIPANGHRVQDILLDRNSNYARLIDVQIYADIKRTACVAVLPQAMVPKDRIELVILPDDQHEAPVKRWNNYSARSTAHISAIVGEYYVEGELQLPQSTMDVVHALIQQLGTFFPITRASIIGPDAQRMGAPVVFVNKGVLSCFHTDSSAKAESSAAEFESSLS